ncbi:mammalian cell entry protein [Mycobacterium sp. 1245111.1]|uniref:MlaD family protein n=1 Tax=Mycobacterium sp. 1245111.1 TaxID=1834073 RepID=UPI000801219E|nr:MCE family protein [Mycobacterium sp. 1245111.1]OBK35607.1 mammalian cell entry protein [Mycobacterium sp. 1245111.1]
MRFRAPLIGLSLFMIVALTVTWLVYASLRRDVAGTTEPYAAVFSDVYGLREGDDVRVAGVRVGRVEKVDLDGKLAKVSFVVQRDQRLFANTIASVTYQNIVGQRYLGLSLGAQGDSLPLTPGSVIPLDRTEPSFDVTALLNGYEPLFSLLNPHDADNLTKGILESLQGDTSSLATLVSQTSTLAETFAGRDQALGTVIDNLNKVLGNLAAQNSDFDSAITQTRQVVAALDKRRPELQSSFGSLSKTLSHVATYARSDYPAFREFVDRKPGLMRHLIDVEPQVAFFGDNVPLLLKGLTRVGNQGAFGNAYLCDVNFLSFFPGLNDVVPIIVNAATPGNKMQFTPRCRNMADG